jgi:Glyoxalase-like domain
MRIDHVIIGARRLDEARELLWSGYGFGLTDGTSNGDGTESWLVPFESPEVQYIELIVVSRERELMETDYGRTLLERTADGSAFIAWAVAVEQIEEAAARVRRLTGEDPELVRGESVRADGERMPWSEVAFRAAYAAPSRPFFLQYGNWPARRARLPRDLASAAHRCTPTRLQRVTVLSADDGPARWLGGPMPFVALRRASCEAMESVEIGTTAGVIEMRLGGIQAADRDLR